MNVNAVQLAMTLAGDEDQQKMQCLCDAAQAQLSARLREGVTAEDCGGAFPCAVAWLALALRALEEGGREDCASFTAGDLSIHGKTAAEGERLSATLRREAYLLLQPWLKDENFAFRSVKT